MPTLEFTPVRDRRPLAVQVYDRLHDALVASARPGTEIPTEIELTAQLGVSRTTVRQALALLEEDGVLERGAGRRRLVAHPDARASTGPRSLEEMLDGDAQEVRAIARRTQPATGWSAGLLGVDRGTDLIVWESVVAIDGVVVASALELALPALSEELREEAGRTLLASLDRAARGRLRQTLLRCTTAGGGTREGFPRDPGDPHEAPVVALTQRLERGAVAVYLAKHLVRLGAVSLSLA